MEEDEKQGVLFARFTLLWKHWKSHMSMRRCLAEERVLAGLSAPVIRDVASVRSYVAGIADTSSAFRCLEKLFGGAEGADCRYHDILRICERVAWFAALSVPFHYTQLTSQEFLAYIQTILVGAFPAALCCTSSQQQSSDS